MTCRLEYLDICGNTTIVDETFINNADKFTQLKYLNLVRIELFKRFNPDNLSD